MTVPPGGVTMHKCLHISQFSVITTKTMLSYEFWHIFEILANTLKDNAILTNLIEV